MQRLLIGFLGAFSLAAVTSVAIALTSQVKLTKTNVDASPEALFALIEDFHK